LQLWLFWFWLYKLPSILVESTCKPSLYFSKPLHRLLQVHPGPAICCNDQ
jgi:hypothetical protein